MIPALSQLNLTGRRRLPVILQSETAECGLACLAMIAGYHGRNEGLMTLRQRFGVGARGATLNNLIQISGGLGLVGRALRCELSELSRVSTPAILHWDFSHFVVLKSANRRSITIHDPAVGIRTWPLEEAGHHVTGIVLEVSPGSDFEPANEAHSLPLSSFFKGLGSLVPNLFQILVLSALIQLVALTTPFYMQLVVDEVLVKHDADLLTLLAAGFLMLTLFSVMTQALRGWAGLYLSHQLSFTMGARLFQHLLRLPTTYFAKRHMGDIVSRFGSLKPIQDFISSSAITVLLDGVMAVTTLTMMFLYSPTLATIVLAAMLAYLLAQMAFYVPIKRREHESIAAEARLDSNFMETVRSISAIKRFAIEGERNSQWQNRFADAINARVHVGGLSLGVELIDSLISGLSHVIVIFAGANLVLDGEITIGMLYAFLAYRSHLTGAITSLVAEFVKYLMLSLHLERLADIRLSETEDDHVSQLPLPIDGTLTLEAASFRYSNQDPWVFSNLSLTIETGETVAIFGPSGCGKSTLMACLQCALQLSAGELQIDHRRVDQLGLASLRQGCAGVMQDDCLLSGTLRSNIALGDSLPDQRRVEAATRVACIHDEITRFPMGYDSLVGEMGASLSAGQVQRVLIARAVYREPRILFLDEGTAHLDSETEGCVMRNLLAQPFSCVFITHNRALLAHADKVILRRGERWEMKRIRQSRMVA